MGNLSKDARYDGSHLPCTALGDSQIKEFESFVEIFQEAWYSLAPPCAELCTIVKEIPSNILATELLLDTDLKIT